MSEVNLQQVSKEVWTNKYALKNWRGEMVDLCIEDTFSRVSEALAASQYPHDEEKRESASLEYYSAMIDGAIPAGRILANAGAEPHKSNVSLINCVVSGKIEDSMESILDRLHDAGMTLKGGSGIGYCFSNLRPKGSLVGGAGSFTNGPLGFMDSYDALCGTISSAGGRRGAQMATFHVSHPDVIEFIQAKRQAGRLRHFNLSVLVTDEFLTAVELDKKWVFTFEGKTEDKAGRPYGSIMARDLWDLIMRSSYEFSEPGVIFIDRVNRMNPLSFCETIEASNPCVAEGTLVATEKGYIPVEDVKVGDRIVVVNGELGTVETIEVHDDVDVYNVVLSDGSMVKATAAHIFHSKKGGDKKWNTNKRLDELSIGDEIRISDAVPGTMMTPDLAGMSERDKGFLIGVILGDGSFAPSRGNLDLVVGLNQEPWLNQLTEFLDANNIKYSVYKDKTAWRINLLNGFKYELERIMDRAKSPDKVIPAFAYTANKDFLLGLVDGIISTDGNVHVNNTNPMVRVSSRSHELLIGLKHVLSMLGIHGRIYETKKGRTVIDGREINFTGKVHTLCIIGTDIKRVHDIGVTHYERKDRLRELVVGYNLTGGGRTGKIVSIEYAGKAKVYDLFEPSTDSWLVNGGIVSLGCGEQVLPGYGACLLGSIDLTKFVTSPFVNPSFDSGKFKHVVRVFQRMLDAVVELNGLPLPEQRAMILETRRRGMGFFGLSSALAMMGIRYGSSQAIDFVDQICKIMAQGSLLESIEMAKEFGACPRLADKDNLYKFANSQFIQRVIDSLGMKIKDDLLKYGARWTHSTSIAPTGTISLSIGNNASSGIEPTFSHVATRNIVTEGRKTKTAATVYSVEYLHYQKFYGRAIENIPDHFVTAEDVTVEEHLKMQAAAQRWVDSSISKTTNVATDMPFDDFKGIYSRAASLGLKGCTTFRFNPAMFQGVIVDPENLKRTLYEFTCADGSTSTFSGDELVEWEGEVTTAANLFDYLKESHK